jgi:uncharacterized protein YrrD
MASQLKKCPVITPAKGKVGELGDVIIDPENGKLLGFKIKKTLINPIQVVSISDIMALDPRVVIINSEESIIAPEEIIRISEVLKKKYKIIGAKATTESKSNLGKVEDVVIDSETSSIVRFYLKGLVRSRILPTEYVIEIKPKQIIFSDKVNNAPIASEAAAA